RVHITEKSLPIMLLRAREAVMRRFRPMLRLHDLSEQQWRVLRVLHEQGPTEPTVLAEQSVVLTPSLTRILANLEGRGLISRKRHNDDGRKQVAILSPKGRELIAQITPQSTAIYAELEAAFGSADTHELMQALRRLTAL
ncbi:MAG: homoprotocatechuate degradation regulator HpaR, partial [Paracoccaceae bacterium]